MPRLVKRPDYIPIEVVRTVDKGSPSSVSTLSSVPTPSSVSTPSSDSSCSDNYVEISEIAVQLEKRLTKLNLPEDVLGMARFLKLQVNHIHGKLQRMRSECTCSSRRLQQQQQQEAVFAADPVIVTPKSDEERSDSFSIISNKSSEEGNTSAVVTSKTGEDRRSDNGDSVDQCNDTETGGPGRDTIN